jgi:energy-coupling factor transporter ATP-binding protein EcfA2
MISKLVVSNVKRVRYVVIEPDPADPVVIIRGENGAGKSTLLDAIRYAYAGKHSHPPRVIRDGAREAYVEVDDENLEVTRKWDAETNSTVVEVRSKNGEKLKSPQAVLDQLYSDIAFAPEMLMHMPGPEQRALLCKATGINTDLLDREHDRLFEERTVTGRDLKAAKARLDAHKQTEQPPPASDTAGLVKQQQDLNARKARVSTAIAERQAADRRVNDCQVHVRAAENAVKQALEALEAAKVRLQTATDARAKADNIVDEAEENAEGVEARLEQIATELNHAAAVGAAHARWDERCRLADEVALLQAKHNEQDTRIAEIRSQVEEIIAGAKFPVPGLGFTSSGIKLNGLPFEQASQAEQLRVSVGIAVTLNPRFRVMLIRQGSLLDKRSMALLRQLCTEFKVQAWVEAVGEEGPATVVIVDGAVAA